MNPSSHDIFVLDPPELDAIECPQCSGLGIVGKSNCSLCEGGCEVPPILRAMYNQEIKANN